MRLIPCITTCIAALSIGLAPAASLANDAVAVGGSINPAAAVTAAAQAFHEQNPAIEVDVHATNAGNGIVGLREGRLDIAMVDTTVDDPSFADHPIGTLGVAILVGPHAGVQNITRSQMIGIYSGKITNWKQIGGEDRKIVPISRPLGTGIRLAFERLVAKTTIDSVAPEKPSEVKSLLENTPGSIAYLATTYVDPASDRVLTYNGVALTPENIRNHSYQFAMLEHLYTRVTPSAPAKAFIDFITSDRALLEKYGIL